MRSSKSRSRSKTNRPRTLGNIINRVFDSSGPEGKVRGTPQQIIEKYQMLARDAQLSNDRVAAENFLQHAEHYTRLLAEATREMAAEQDARQQFQQNSPSGQGNGQNGGNQGGNGQGGYGQGGNNQNRDRQQGDYRPERSDYRSDRNDASDSDQPYGSGFSVVNEDEQPALVDLPESGQNQQRRDEPRRDDGRNDQPRNDQPRNNQNRRQDNRPRDERPRDERPRDERPQENRSQENRPREDRQQDNRPRDERPRDERPRDQPRAPRHENRQGDRMVEQPAVADAPHAEAPVPKPPGRAPVPKPHGVSRRGLNRPQPLLRKWNKLLPHQSRARRKRPQKRIVPAQRPPSPAWSGRVKSPRRNWIWADPDRSRPTRQNNKKARARRGPFA